MPAPDTDAAPRAPEPVLLFDAECGLCLRCVRVLLNSDVQGRLRFMPLQSPAGQALLREKGLPTDAFDSVLFIADWARRAEATLFRRTDAVIAAAEQVRGGWRRLRWLRVLPRWLRDGGYRVVARLRGSFSWKDDRSERLQALRASGRLRES
jgi:predicted DCC family thiol-disulfide oxidoreductase YuxK